MTLPYTGLTFPVMQCFLFSSKTHPHSFSVEVCKRVTEKVKRERTGDKAEVVSREEDSGGSSEYYSWLPAH